MAKRVIKKPSSPAAPSLDGISKAIQQLERRAELKEEDRRFIMDALDYLFVSLFFERRLHRLKGTVANTWFAAMVAQELVDHHGLGQTTAIATAVGKGDSRDFARVKAAYYRLDEAPARDALDIRLIKEAALKLSRKKE